MSLSRRRSTAVLAAVGVAVAAAAATALLTGGAPAGAAPGTPGCSAQPSFDYTIPGPQGAPAATSLPGGVGFSILGADAKTYFVGTNIDSDTLAVDALACLGGLGVDNPSIAYTGTTFAAYVRAGNGIIYQNYWAASGQPGTAWSKVPNGLAGGGPAAVAGANGSVDLFLRGTNGALYQANRSRTGVWSAFRNLGGGLVGTPAVAPRPGGGYVVVITAPTGYLYTRSSTAAGVWGAWTRIAGTAATNPALTAGYSAGRLDLFVIGQTGGLYQSAYLSGRFGTFKQIESTVLPTTAVAAAATPGRLIVYITEVSDQGPVTAYTQYLPGGWTGTRDPANPYYLAPYTWPEGAPDGAEVNKRTTDATTGAGTTQRPAPRRGLR